MLAPLLAAPQASLGHRRRTHALLSSQQPLEAAVAALEEPVAAGEPPGESFAVLTLTPERGRVLHALVCACFWRWHLGYTPYLVLVGNSSRFAACGVSDALLQPLVERLQGRLYRFDAPEANDSWVDQPKYRSQTLRLYAAALPGIRPADEIVTTDADRVPVSRAFFRQRLETGGFLRLSHQRGPGLGMDGHCAAARAAAISCARTNGSTAKAEAYRRLCANGSFFDMCYVRGYASAWRAAFFGERALDWRAMLDDMLVYHRWARRGAHHPRAAMQKTGRR